MPKTETKGAVTLDDLMKEIKASTEVTKGVKADLKKLTTTVKDNNSTMKTFMDKTNKAIDTLKEDNIELNQKVKSLEDSMTAVTDQLTVA